jgi:DNA-binding transcriptional MerR regulator
MSMRISELSAATGVPVATVKYYLREGLLYPGEATSATQAQYDDSHVRRLRLARALVQVGGLSVAGAREVLAALDSGPASLHDVLGVAHSALPPRPEGDLDPARTLRLARAWGWRVHPDAPSLRQLERALMALDELGVPATEEALTAYADAARRVAEVDVSGLPTTTAEDAATAAVVGTILYEPVLLALRRMAQEAVSAELFSATTP